MISSLFKIRVQNTNAGPISIDGHEKLHARIFGELPAFVSIT